LPEEKPKQPGEPKAGWKMRGREKSSVPEKLKIEK
jgi:hypothetical protein